MRIAIFTLLVAVSGTVAAPAKPVTFVRDIQALAEANNKFALALYGKLQADGGNLVVSPYSIQSGLTMAWVGARGDTAKEMYAALNLPVTRIRTPIANKNGKPEQYWLHHVPWRPNRIASATRNWIDRFNAAGKRGDMELIVANAIWSAFPVEESYSLVVKKCFRAPVVQISFSERNLSFINYWIAKQTKGLIKELLQPGDVAADTRLVLTNAIYFRGDWASRFDPKDTQDKPFHLAPNKQISVPTMWRKGDFWYHKTGQLKGPGQAVATAELLELVYKGNAATMVIILPDSAKPESLATVEANLPANLKGWLKAMRKTKVEVELPKWKHTWRAQLQKPLAAMGMKRAFSPAADFSGISKNDKLFIDRVIHEAVIEVNEKGTTAGAATAVAMAKNGYHHQPTSITFKADRPFLYLIRDSQTGAILFLGRVCNPQK